MARVPNISTPITGQSPVNSVWFRFFEEISRQLGRTISTTVGSQTINAPIGKFEVAAAATNVTINNSSVTDSAIVVCSVASNDATARINNVTTASGSFTVNLTAPTAQTSIAFVVL